MAIEYVSDLSDLKVIIHHIIYRSKTYWKFKASLVDKRNGIFYEKGIYKVRYDAIKHWRRL